MNYYIYNLDKKYNENLYPIKINNNDIIKNIEKKISNNNFLRSQYSLEIYIHNIIKKSDYLVYNLEESKIVFFPIYLFLLAWKPDDYVYNVKNIVEKLNEIIPIINNISSEKKILLCYSDVMWEDNRCFINYFKFPKNVTIITYEEVKDRFNNNKINLPFITNIKCDPDKYFIKFKVKKRKLCYIGRYRKEINYSKNIFFYDTNKYQKIKDQWISFNNSELYNDISKIYKSFYFSLQPHGDKQTRKGFYHSLLLGCIPVIFENNFKIYKKIFQKFIKIDDIAIIIKNDEINNIDNILETKIRFLPKMINNINKIKNLLLFPDKNDFLLKYIYNNI